MRIHILKHSHRGYAERVFTQIARSRGHTILTVDPRDVLSLLKTRPPDAVLARCELDRFDDPIFSDYLAAFYQYEQFDIPVMNPALFLLVGQDKYLSHLVVEKMLQDYPREQCFTPETIRVSRRENVIRKAASFFDQYGGVVVKPPCSGRGKGIFFVETQDQMARVLEFYNAQETVLLQQPILKESNTVGRLRDIRLWVLRDPVTGQTRVVDAFYRVGAPGSFLTNLSQGASIEPMQRIDPVLQQFAQDIFYALGGHVAGVDVAKDIHGQYWFEEVNVAFETGIDTIRLLGDEIWRDALRLMERYVQTHRKERDLNFELHAP